MQAFITHFLRKFKQLGVLTPALALVAWASFSSCETVEIDGPPRDTATKDSVNLRVTNQIQQDPDSIALFLYPGTSVDISNATNSVLLGKVDTNQTVVFKVPVGAFKLAYKDGTGSLVPMRDEKSAGQEWLKSIFVKSGDYSLILSTDVNRTIWKPTFQTLPAMQ